MLPNLHGILLVLRSLGAQVLLQQPACESHWLNRGLCRFSASDSTDLLHQQPFRSLTLLALSCTTAVTFFASWTPRQHWQVPASNWKCVGSCLFLLSAARSSHQHIVHHYCHVALLCMRLATVGHQGDILDLDSFWHPWCIAPTVAVPLVLLIVVLPVSTVGCFVCFVWRRFSNANALALSEI